MKLDAIVGNPPYHRANGGGVGSSGEAIYHLFVNLAQQMKPNYVSMIMESRWMTGGGNLESFKNAFISCNKLKFLTDFYDSHECFKTVEIKGGICYFLYDKNYSDKCHIVTHVSGSEILNSYRYLKEDNCNVFIRDSRYIGIFRKVQSFKEDKFSSIVSANDPYGFDKRLPNSMRRAKVDYSIIPNEGDIAFYYNGWRKEGIGYVKPTQITKGNGSVNQAKVFIPKAWGAGIVYKDWLKPFIPIIPCCCTETYLVVGPFGNETIANNVVTYIQTKFFHLMVSILKNTQNSMQDNYQFVPLQDFTKPWTDEELYKKYNLDEYEIAFIESMIKPME